MRKTLAVLVGVWIGVILAIFSTHRLFLALEDGLFLTCILIFAYSILKLIKLSKK